MSNKAFAVYSSPVTTKFLIETDTLHLMLLTVQLAANIIHQAKNIATDGSASNGPSVLVERKMSRWAAHGTSNALLSQVTLLHAIAEMLVTNPSDMSRGIFFMDDRKDIVSIVIEALSAYQTWKNNHVKKEQDINGRHWGSATWFFQVDFTDVVPALKKLL